MQQPPPLHPGDDDDHRSESKHQEWWVLPLVLYRALQWGSTAKSLIVALLGLLGFYGYKHVTGARENIDDNERAIAAQLKPAVCPVEEEIKTFEREIGEAFAAGRYDELERTAQDLKTSRALFRDGSWKLVHFYDACRCAGENNDEWEREEKLQTGWVAASPQSLTARLSYANFLMRYAWHARGYGWAHTITTEGHILMAKRMGDCARVLEDARKMEMDDPMWWDIALTLALGQGWPKEEFDAFVDEAHAFEPTFWAVDTARAYSLMPRWYGKPGDWEAYAAQAADRPDGLGNETYARIVISMARYHSSVFRETRASWPRTKEGLEILQRKYPDATKFTSYAALLATMAFDRPTAQAKYAELGDAFLPEVWPSAESFAHYRHWAETGQW